MRKRWRAACASLGLGLFCPLLPNLLPSSEDHLFMMPTLHIHLIHLVSFAGHSELDLEAHIVVYRRCHPLGAARHPELASWLRCMGTVIHLVSFTRHSVLDLYAKTSNYTFCSLSSPPSASSEALGF